MENKNKYNNRRKNMIGIKIIIKQIESKQGEYIAYYKSELLKATYSVYFRDNIFGAIALHDFSEMIKGKYKKEDIEFIISEEKLQFKNKALQEAMSLK